MKSNQLAASTTEASGSTTANKRNGEHDNMFIDEHLQLRALGEERRAELYELLNQLRGNQDDDDGYRGDDLMMVMEEMT